MDNKKQFRRVGTHDGRFHADEVMATAILKEVYEIELTRTRDENVLKTLDIVYDVGGGEFDHHGMDKIYRENGTPYAACGLIWRGFGKEVIKIKDPSLKDEEVDLLYNYIDRAVIEGMDALDNGVKIGDTTIPILNISTIISGFNPPWYKENDEDKAFNEAVNVASSVLRNKISHKLSVFKSRELVENAYKSRVRPEVLVLDTYCPYGELLKNIDEAKEVLYVVYKSKVNYAAQSVRDYNGEDRKKFPKAWAGKRDEELAKVTGVKDSVFCHSGRFIAIAQSLEGIMTLVDLAIKEPEENSSGGFFKFLEKLFSRK